MIILTCYLVYALLLTAALWRTGLRHATLVATTVPRKQFSRLLIIGATGGTGRQLVLQALERGYEVTALVRNPARLQINHPQFTVVQGDILDPATVEAAMQGQEAVVSALGHKKYFYPTRILSEGTRNILQAMKMHSVRRIICETSLGIGSSVGRMGLYYTFFVIPVILPFYFWDKTRQEKLIAASALEWVIVRPGGLTDGKKRGSIRHGYHIGNFLWTVRISRADVAQFMLDQLESDTYLGTPVSIA